MSNRIIIGNSRNKKDAPRKEGIYGPAGEDSHIIALPVQKAIPIPLDEKVWGNDNAILDNLDKSQLANRRLFVRVRHLQKIICNKEYADIDKEPDEMDKPLEFTVVDLSVGGIGIVCDREISKGRILGVRLVIDGIPYDIRCEVMYCIPNDDKFRAGLSIALKEKQFMRHLKIFVARTSLNSEYASAE